MKSFILLITLATMVGCNSKSEDPYRPSFSATDIAYSTTEHPGKELMKTYCYACHNPTTAEADRIAPPMIAIKRHYITENTTKEEFTHAVMNWVKGPVPEKAKLYGAVRRFGVMPYQAFSEDTIQKISEYIYDYEIEQPEWFEEHYQKGAGMKQGMGRRRQ